MGLAEILVGGLEQGLGGLYPFLSNTPSGSPAFVFTSNANFGEIKSQGLELAFNYSIDNKWFLDFNYSWSEFEVRDELPEAPLEANGPENKANLRIGYAGGRIAGSLHYRWFDSFLWSEGFFFGTVPSYGVVNLEGSFEVSDQWRVGVSVSNLLDNEHYEFFSGDLVGRHALAYGTFSW